MSKWLLAFLVLLIAAGYWFAPSYLGLEKPVDILSVPESCEFGPQACDLFLPEEVGISIRVEGDIRPLSTFTISVSGEKLLAVAVTFEMLDMDMGINRYRLSKSRSAETWTTPAMLPVCTTGRTDWLAYFDVRLSNGKSYRLEYPFSADGSSIPG